MPSKDNLEAGFLLKKDNVHLENSLFFSSLISLDYSVFIVDKEELGNSSCSRTELQN